MAAVGFVTLLKNFSVRKLLFGVALLALMIFFSHMHHLHIKTFSLVPVRSVAVFIVCVGMLRRIYKSNPNLLFGLHQLRSVFCFRVNLFKTVLGLELLF